MKPIRLVIAGLNSFKEAQEIDFTHLCQGSVFGIFGPTGSGKSTIIDAITLALYGSVKRAARKTQGIVNKSLTEASVTFEFQLGAGDARKHYRVERRYAVKDDSVNCRLARLSRLEGDVILVLADKPSMVDQAVAEILGLTEDDFTRAVVLPQGHFAEFLNLQGSERRRMLERIFGLEEYGEKLNRVVSERLKTTETDLQGVERSQTLLGDATVVALAAAEEETATAQVELTAAQERALQAQAQRERWRRVRELQSELAQAQADMIALQEGAGAMGELQARLEQHEAAQRISSTLQAYDRTAMRLAQAAVMLEQAEQTAAVEQQALATAQVAASRAASSKQEQEEPLLQRLEQLTRALQLERQLVQVEQAMVAKVAAGRELTDGLQALEQVVTALQQSLTLTDNKLQDWRSQQEGQRISAQQRERITAAVANNESLLLLEGQLQTLRQQLEQRQSQLSVTQAQLASGEERLVAYLADEAEQRQCWQELEQQIPINVTSRQLVAANGLLRDAQQLQQDGDRRQRLQESVATLTETSGELERRLRQSEANMLTHTARIKATEQQMEALEQAVAAVRERQLAALLAGSLASGQACPVCGSQEHPAPQSFPTDGELERLQTELVAVRTELTAQQAERITVQTVAAAAAAELQRQREALEAAQSELQIAEAHLAEQLGKFPAEWIAAHPWSAMLQLAQNHLADLSQQVDKYQTWQVEMGAAKDAFEAAAAQTRQQQQELELLQQALDGQQNELQQLQVSENNLHPDVARRRAELAGYLSALGESDLATALRLYRERDARLAELEQLIQEQEKARSQLLQEIRQREQEVGSLKESQAEARAAYRAQLAQQAELQQELTAITAGEAAATLRQATREILAGVRERAAATQDAWEQARQRLSDARQQQSAAAEAQRLASSELQQAEASLETALTRERFSTREAAETALAWADSVVAWRQRLNTYRKQTEFLQERTVELEQRLAGQFISEQAWQELVEQERQAVDDHLQTIEALATAQSGLENLRLRHQQWLELEEERQRLAASRQLLQELASLLRGNALVEFMAGEHLDAIAAIATNWLGLLTGQRYALEVAPDGGFLIRDDGNGGSKRPVATLSGGETFITSLALALALSSQIQLRGKHNLEFFFLDEGFGSLDADLLETVMNCLERMQGQAMSIGIISHVPELRERIMCQVLVQPAQQGGSGSRLQVVTG